MAARHGYANSITIQPSLALDTSLPLGGHKIGMTFRDATTGWIGGETPAEEVYLYKTTNSGATWALQHVAFPTGYESPLAVSTTAPTFFGANDAVLPVWISTGISMRDLFIYTSHDGGTTWLPSSGFARNGYQTNFVSARDAISWDLANVFHVTNDSGNSWKLVTPNVNFSDEFGGMDFVSTTTGWVILRHADGSTSLYRTTDGGSTWTLLNGVAPTATPNPVPQDFNTFGQTLVTALNARNFDLVKVLMDQSFGFAFWQSEGFSTTTDLAIQSLQTNYLGATPLTPNASQDLNALLDGLNPYTIMGLDPTNRKDCLSRAGAWTVKAKPFYMPHAGPDGSPYWHSVLIAPAGFAPPTTPSLQGPYAVTGIAANDVLNIRSGAGVSYPIVGSFAPEAINVMRTGPMTSADSAFWVEVQKPDGGTGWVNFAYLTEYVSHDAFCADTRIAALIEQLKGSMNQSNGDMFSGIISLRNDHGVNIHLWKNAAPINFTRATASSVFTSAEVYNWGGGPSGQPDIGTFAQIIQPKLLDTLNAPNMEIHCDDLTNVFPLFDPWPYHTIRFYNLRKPSTSPELLDFRTWLIGIEYINNQPYLYAMISIVWEP
jgi:hypothetical protein